MIPILKKDVIKVFNKISNEKIQSIKQIIGKGDVNQVYVIETSKDKVLLRLNNERDEFRKEEWCINEAKKKGVLGPEILKVGRLGKITFMAYRFIEGESGKESKVEKSQIWRKLGEYARKINSIKTKGYGDKLITKTGKFSGSWSKFINYNIKSLNEDDKLIELKVYTEKQLPIIKKYFIKLKLKKHHVGLTHNDLVLGNVIIDKKGNYILIDWGCAESNIIPYGEFVEVLGYRLLEYKELNLTDFYEFSRGYGFKRGEYEKLKKEIGIFLLLSAFDKLRWAIDKKHKNIKNYVKTAKLRLKYVLENEY